MFISQIGIFGFIIFLVVIKSYVQGFLTFANMLKEIRNICYIENDRSSSVAGLEDLEDLAGQECRCSCILILTIYYEQHKIYYICIYRYTYSYL